ncbi:hypothetical protein L6164_024654 [Bauhinia variegata]|uniref:Uncharacterized protein n=1 Tax=Bauhinia variegata TaxID=167791 RepID=A0ACB9LZP9_BAUVA|nr:hypothetical protein L6164_024654 [Bauhinia variegata]
MSFLSKLPPHVNSPINPIPFQLSPVVLSFYFGRKTPVLHRRICALKTGGDGNSNRSEDVLRKPLISEGKDVGGILEEKTHFEDDNSEDERWIDWEDQILEDTVPLVSVVRMILHSGIYDSGDRLSPEHEKTILEKLLPFHPDFKKKIGCGIDYITMGYHPNFEGSRCMFIARKDGELVDFSYWKCIKGLIRKNYPLYADSFILRHFRQRSRNLRN